MGSCGRPLFVLSDLSAGGAEQSTLRLLGDLALRGLEPTLFLLRHRGEFLGRVPRDVRLTWALDGDARVHRNAVFIIRKLLRCVRDSDVVVGALELESTYFAYVCGRLLQRPVIGWVHAVMGEHLKELSPIHTRLGRFVYPRMDQLVFPSQGAADSLARVARLRRENLTVIPSYLDVPSLQARALDPLPQWAAQVFAKPTVVNVGRLVPSKGLDTLLHAHARVRAEGIDHHLLIVGEGSLRNELEQLARCLGVRNSVFMSGFVPNPYPLIKAADVFALSSRFEGLPLVLLEALGIGTAIVAADCPGGPSAVLEGGRYGLLVAPDDAAALATSVARLLRESSLRERLSAGGPARAGEFTRASILPRWERILAAPR